MTTLILVTISGFMRRDGMEGRNARQNPSAEDLDDISTLINLLDLGASLRGVTSRLDSELD